MTSNYRLEELLEPLSRSDFVANHWEKLPVVLTHHSRAQSYKALLELNQVESVLLTGALGYSDVRLIKSDIETDVRKFSLPTDAGTSHYSRLDVSQIVNEYRQGATLVLQGAHRWHPSLFTLCSEIAEFFHAQVWANVYITPKGSRGFHTHYDTHDVFVLQIDGEKVWNIQEKVLDNPLPDQPEISYAPDLSSLHEIILKPGDLIYMPRGFAHYALTNQSLSCHITIGVQTLTLRDCILQYIKAASHEDERLRKSAFAPLETQEDAAANAMALFKEILSRKDNHDKSWMASFDEALRAKFGALAVSAPLVALAMDTDKQQETLQV